jgi:hypothetical protein
MGRISWPPTSYLAFVTLGAGAVLGGLVGYLVRRKEHLREQRLDSFGVLVSTFIEAARSGAALLSVHFQVGYPHELSRETWNEEQVRTMTEAHSSAWAQGSVARNAFELAAIKAELVATKGTAKVIEDLRTFLDGALYSGSPWGYSKDYPKSALNPSDIESKALEQIRPHVQATARELWGRHAPKQ